jgi:hypothetical protein
MPWAITATNDAQVVAKTTPESRPILSFPNTVFLSNYQAMPSVDQIENHRGVPQILNGL